MRHRSVVALSVVSFTLGEWSPRARAQAPWGASVIAYSPGLNATYQDPSRALGQPSRFTGEQSLFPGAVTPFNPPYLPGEIVSVGSGGFLTLELGRAARDRPDNPFGVDLLAFSNAFLLDVAWPAGLAGPLVAATPAFEASADGLDWRPLTLRSIAPTLGFLDAGDPYSAPVGQSRSDFTRPLDPSFDPSGRAFGEIVAAYAASGSGGGYALDLAGSGLFEARFVRVRVERAEPFQLDGVGVVSPLPAPGGVPLALGFGLAASGRRRRCTR